MQILIGIGNLDVGHGTFSVQCENPVFPSCLDRNHGKKNRCLYCPGCSLLARRWGTLYCDLTHTDHCMFVSTNTFFEIVNGHNEVVRHKTCQMKTVSSTLLSCTTKTTCLMFSRPGNSILALGWKGSLREERFFLVEGALLRLADVLSERNLSAGKERKQKKSIPAACTEFRAGF